MEPGQRGRRIVLSVNSPPVAIPTGVDENTLEEELDALERAQAVISLDRIHQDSVTRGTDRMSQREIQIEIDSVRAGQMS